MGTTGNFELNVTWPDVYLECVGSEEEELQPEQERLIRRLWQ